jgi:succinate-semialdehyde dehydrogenase/glutarate-semialdehyde dehydrogenase
MIADSVLQKNLEALTLQDPQLWRPHCYIADKWQAADSGAVTIVRNPATGGMLAEVPDCGEGETHRAIAAAATALPAWSAFTAGERSRLLRRWFDLMIQHCEDLALILTAEQGKPLNEARGEIRYAASFIEWFGEEAKRVYGDMIPGHVANRRLLVMRQPIGVVAAITPWNFPTAMITRKCAPALAAGCTFVCKPAMETPLSAFALAELAQRAGIPAGVFNVVSGSDAAKIGGEMTANPLVRKLSFTGSTRVGVLLATQCAAGLKKVSLELGGNAPFLVFDDADVQSAVQGAIASKYRNSGQTCVCTNRFLVQAGIYERFSEELAAAVKQLKVGNGMHADVKQGPLITHRAVAKVEQHLDDALAKGGRILTGGKRHALGGTFFEPTVVAYANQTMLLSSEETFGPVAPLFKFESEADALRMANDTEFGLAGYLYTRDLARAWRVSEQLEVGMVGVNTGLISTEVAPFGGIKMSGMGREGSKYGIYDYTELKYLCVGID